MDTLQTKEFNMSTPVIWEWLTFSTSMAWVLSQSSVLGKTNPGESLFQYFGDKLAQAVHFLNKDNQYTGADVSPGLLKQAAKRLIRAGFQNPEFYVVSAYDLPFENESFDVCLCILSLNFIGNVEKVFQEINRVLLPNGLFICSVPVPERNRLQSMIRGSLYSEIKLEELCPKHGFEFQPIACENGALLYFTAMSGDRGGKL